MYFNSYFFGGFQITHSTHYLGFWPHLPFPGSFPTSLVPPMRGLDACSQGGHDSDVITSYPPIATSFSPVSDARSEIRWEGFHPEKNAEMEWERDASSFLSSVFRRRLAPYHLLQKKALMGVVGGRHQIWKEGTRSKSKLIGVTLMEVRQISFQLTVISRVEVKDFEILRLICRKFA